MTPRPRLGPRPAWIAVALALTLIVLACGGNGETPEDTPTPQPPPSPTPTATPQPTPVPTPTEQPEEAVNLIAYVGQDDNIYTIRPDGTDQEWSRYPWPGRPHPSSGAVSSTITPSTTGPPGLPTPPKLAFTSYSANGDFAGALWLVDVPGGLPDKVFEDPEDTIGRFVAQRSPTTSTGLPRATGWPSWPPPPSPSSST